MFVSEVMKTGDYSIFKKHPNNRPIDQGNLKRIISSIKSLNLLKFRPILVDSEMRVVDGQHRLEAAKTLGKEVFYQINETSTHEDIALLNAAQKRWSMKEYTDYYASLGNENYSKLKSFCEQTNTPPNEAIKLCRKTGGRGFQAFRKGQFTFFSDEEEKASKEIIHSANDLVEFCSRLTISGSSFMKSARFRSAILLLSIEEGFDSGLFKKKLEQKWANIRPCPDLRSYYILFRDIYNWRNQNPLP